MQDVYSRIISEVQHPSRYIGDEVNACVKDPAQAEVKVALAFPDLYEIGMSNLGLKVLYSIINERPDALAERFFSPDFDFEEKLIAANEPLRSLENRISLWEFDIVGFTLQYELSYTNILKMLKLGGIPLRSSERDETYPLIIGGGPCAYNPEPLADFFDIFVIGEGEEVIGEIIEGYKRLKGDKANRAEMLDTLAEIEGVYVPSFFDISYNADGGIKAIKPLKKGYEKIRKRFVKDLNDAPYPTSQVVPFASLIHDRISVEIDRGCTQGCRFCQAGMIYRPARERSPKEVLRLVDESIKNTGYEEVSLSSLSVGDNSSIMPILCNVMASHSNDMTSISLPSLRPDTIKGEILEEIKKVRKTGFTIAPEAASPRLRRVINKKITDEDILGAVSHIAAADWISLKLYFMIGLPTETIEEIENIADLCYRILRDEKKIETISVSISSFVPKAHTPFQWVGQRKRDYFREIHNLLQKRLRGRRLNMKWHDVSMSLLEAVFARGDRRLGKVLAEAVERGCSFDGWSERFNYRIWEDSFKAANLAPEWYAERDIELDAILPWSHIESGVSAKYLRSEYEKGMGEIITDDCRYGQCSGCGIMDKDSCPTLKRGETEDVCVDTPLLSHSPVVSFSYRLKYEKVDNCRYISHLELGRLFYRALRRCGLPVSHSQGFHPHPKISFGLALPVGVESICEYVDIQIGDFVSPEKLLGSLNGTLPAGIKILEANLLTGGYGSILQDIGGVRFLVRIETESAERLREILGNYSSKDDIFIERKKKGKVKRINVAPLIGSLNVTLIDKKLVDVDILLLRIGESMVKPNEAIEGIIGGECHYNIKGIKKIGVEWK